MLWGGGISLLLSIIVVFCILGAVVFSVARSISTEMSASEIQNLIECTIEAVLNTGAWCCRPKGMGERSAGHLNLEDFFCANDITEPLNDRINENVFALGSNAGMKLEQWGNTCIIVWMLLRSCRKITDAS